MAGSEYCEQLNSICGYIYIYQYKINLDAINTSVSAAKFSEKISSRSHTQLAQDIFIQIICNRFSTISSKRWLVTFFNMAISQNIPQQENLLKPKRLTLIVMIDRSCLLNMLQARRGVIKPSQHLSVMLKLRHLERTKDLYASFCDIIS